MGLIWQRAVGGAQLEMHGVPTACQVKKQNLFIQYMYASPDFRAFRRPWEDIYNIETLEAISEKSFFLGEATGLKDFRED